MEDNVETTRKSFDFPFSKLIETVRMVKEKTNAETLKGALKERIRWS